MEITTKRTLPILFVLSWIIFVGVCIEAGGFILNAFFAVVNPAVVKHLWHEADLSTLYQYSMWHFVAEMLLMSVVAVMKAWLFYLIIKILHDKKLDMAQPFNRDVRRFIFNIACITFMIGLFSWWGVQYTGWLIRLGIAMPDVQYLRLGGADVWLFMSVTLFVIGQIFKRGVEIQAENDLTI
ncbi:Protein of unknown function [Mucilaginibacter lappiensis]|uniref:Small-conductance mechanosensitive channel n=1 Tax=Mucilaginibacter lappiensis TaxID=354630 RepID=A0ABR6PJ46_9SPHI|nr:DUF2975 domain-containing protein [Mucilaginibacter lappiensis]MBB6109796.1 small-conductance mechanosensitive channel [Mucilaginibacter lappiensis]SIR15816.1 Protein of unknown function [Mucilaginibacter lappiensis]